MYCPVKKLDTLFNESRNNYPIETLINADDKVVDNDASLPTNKWSFDKNTLMIYNNKYWKGFFPID